MKKLKLALMVAVPLLIAACSSSIPNEPTSAGGAAPVVSPSGQGYPYGHPYGHPYPYPYGQAYGHGGGGQ